MGPTFEIATPQNSAMITLNDNLDAAKQHGREPAPTEQWIVGSDVKSITWAIFAYARKHGIAVRDVGYSVVCREER